MPHADIFHKDFKARPFWWEAYTPAITEAVEVPKRARVAIVGGGYAGLCTAIELNRLGIDSVVLEAAEPGFGASTRNGGMVSGGVAVGKIPAPIPRRNWSACTGTPPRVFPSSSG